MIKRQTWLLLILLVVVIGIFFILRGRPTTSTEPTPTALGYNFLVTENSFLASLRMYDPEYHFLLLERGEDAIWTVTLPHPGDADQALAEAAATQALSIRIVTMLETAPSLDTLGLNPPAFTIILTFVNGREYTIEIGSLTPTSSGYYARRSDGQIFVISTSIDALLGLLENPPYASNE
ncbi:MAG: DUF4340 domain-containing protein [Chloroflexota bacterium]